MLKTVWNRFSFIEKIGLGAAVLTLAVSFNSEDVKNSQFKDNAVGLNRCSIFVCN